MAEARDISILSFGDLDGWAEDDHHAALEVFRSTCMDLDAPDWRTLCTLAADAADARAYFELFFAPVLIRDGAEPLFTGYFEPELRAAAEPDEVYRYPVYRVPPELGDVPWLTRREIEESGILADRGLEIGWVSDPVELFFLQIQGSGRLRMADGRVVRLGYGGANGRPYSSIGQELVKRGIYEPHQVSADVIRSWVRRNPDDGQDLLWTNDSYVFFREIGEVPLSKGPLGAMNRSITAGRSVAVDPSIVPLGAPVWLEKDGADPMRRLMVAQDTGSAIKGAQRADIFYGTGRRAGLEAGRIRDGGRMVVLLPIQRAWALLPETV
ncbi:murein transglycosylase A [Histidinibacterium lentulum]|nr:MltA domain-containing protein [Histidinibacterium lentulum]